MVNLSLDETQFASYGNKISRSARERKRKRERDADLRAREKFYFSDI